MVHRSVRLPRRFPVGTRYVVEGRRAADGVFHVSTRYVLLPSGRKIDLSAEKVESAAPAIASKHSHGLTHPRRARARPEPARAGI